MSPLFNLLTLVMLLSVTHRIDSKKFLVNRFSSGSSTVPCTTELVKQCSLSTDQGYNYLKTYPLPLTAENPDMEYSYVFAKGTDYKLKLCLSDLDDTVKVTIMDAQRHVITTSTMSSEVSVMEFRCGSTGIYYLDFSSPVQCCAASSLSFRRSEQPKP